MKTPLPQALAAAVILAGAPPFAAARAAETPPFHDAATAPGQGNFNTGWAGFRRHWEGRQKAFAATRAKDEGAVVFLGDSITEGCDLGKLFPGVHCANRGISGDTTRGMLYRLQDNVIALTPQAVVILGGTNDLFQPGGSPEATAANLKSMAEAIHAAQPGCRVAVLKTMPNAKLPVARARAYNDAADKALAPLGYCVRVDTFSPYLKPDGTFDASMFRDGVHPNAQGYARFKKALEPALAKLTGEEVKVSSWSGYEKLDFKVAGREALLVKPKQVAPGAPWIWRTEFFGAFAQADMALLAKGWHVGYVGMFNMFGSPRSIAIMEKYHAHVTARHGLAKRPVIEGLSRGGLFAFNWAAAHPELTAGLYVDAPVCDFKSWPGGRGRSAGSKDDWQDMLKVYGFSNDDEALAYRLNPVDNLAPLAKARIPILAVVGDADDVVPVEENIGIVEARYKALGGDIKVIRKPGVGHHPHSLQDPAPIVEWAEKVRAR